MVMSHARGHEIVLIDGKWFYACIGYIEGASSARCGHGV